MKRVPLTFAEFLRRLEADPELFPEERHHVAAIRRACESAPGPGTAEASAPGEPTEELRRLVRTLVARGHWEAVEGSVDLESDRLVLRDRNRGVRYRLRLGRPADRAPEQLPFPAFADHEPPPGILRGHLSSPGELVGYDRILGPRDVVTRMEAALIAAVPADAARFHPFELGGEAPEAERGDDPERVRSLPLALPVLDELSRRRDRIYQWTRRDHGVARLLLGIGDDVLGWRGILALEGASANGERSADGRAHGERSVDSRAAEFGPDEIARAAWIASAYAELLSTVLRLQGLIFYDFLTGVYNRSFYEDQLDRELQLARRRQEPMALLLLDIDDFKAFNTQYGYEGGDRVLATVACALKGALRGTDTLARYGGEEFVAILAPPVSAEEAARIAERLRLAVQQEETRLPDLAGGEIGAQVTVSIGGSLYPRHGETRSALWTASNLQLLRAKESGKNQVYFAD